MINLLDNTPNQISKFKIKNWVEEIMTHVERTTLIAKSNAKLQC